LSIQGVSSPSLLNHGKAGLDRVRGYTGAPTKPHEVGVYDVAFYERGFSVPSHQFLYSLRQFYGLELHHLTPSMILHMAAFIILCETYMGIDPHFNLWIYFFRARLR
jgi:hypothetical protein